MRIFLPENTLSLRLEDRDLSPRAAALTLAVLLLAGLWLRLRALGDLSLIGDEGIQFLAVQGILQHGLPITDSGLVYLRSPLFLYFQAALAAAFDASPFWLRLPSVFWGGIAIILAYLLGKTLGTRVTGIGVALLMTFSVWEIELSRYARFYTFFQCCFLVSLWCFYQGFLRDRRAFKGWFLVSAVFTLSSHSLGKSLFLLFLIPLFSEAIPRARKIRFGLWGLGLGGILWLYQRMLRYLGSQGDALAYPTAENAAPALHDRITRFVGVLPLDPPNLDPFFQAARHSLPFVVGLALFAVITSLYLVYLGRSESKAWHSLFAVLIVWMAFFYQFGLVLVLAALYLALFAQGFQTFKERIFQVAGVFSLVGLLAWLSVLMGNTQESLRYVADALFGFPNVPRYFLYWLVMGWPVMTGMLVIGSAWLFAAFIRDRRRHVPLFILGALYFSVLGSSLFRAFPESRYFFHLYPLVVIIVVSVAVSAGALLLRRIGNERRTLRYVGIVLALPALLIVSQDANPWKALQVSERTYRSAKDPMRSVISWSFYADFHQDYETPGRYVNTHRSEQDKVIALGAIHMIGLYHVYAGPVDYALAPASDPAYHGRVKQDTLINTITGSEIISGLPALQALLQRNEQTYWILGDWQLLAKDNVFYSDAEKAFLRTLAKQPVYVGRDEQTFVLKINGHHTIP